MNKMKNTIMLIVLLLISVQVNAVEETTNVKTDSTVTSVDEYTKYLNLFIEEFKSELIKGDFARIDQKIKGYEGDIEYISSEKGTQYASHLDIYKIKLKALKQVREEYISYYKEVKTTIIDSSKEQLLEKEKIIKAIEEKKQRELLEAKQKGEHLKEKTTDVKEKVKEKTTEVKENALEQTKKLSNLELLKQKKTEIIAKHKEEFSKKLEKTIEKLNTTQLEKALARTNELIEKHSSKEVVLVQLVALKELLEEKLSSLEEFDIESIFEGL